MTIKISLKLGSRLQLNEAIEVLPITLAIYDKEGQVRQQESLLSPISSDLRSSFAKWRQYISLNPQDTRKIRIEPETVTPSDPPETENSDVN